jgi:hypothetical protein
LNVEAEAVRCFALRNFNGSDPVNNRLQHGRLLWLD